MISSHFKKTLLISTIERMIKYSTCSFFFYLLTEAPSPSQQKALDSALQCLLKEDPSLKVTVDQDNGQTVVAGKNIIHVF